MLGFCLLNNSKYFILLWIVLSIQQQSGRVGLGVVSFE